MAQFFQKYDFKGKMKNIFFFLKTGFLLKKRDFRQFSSKNRDFRHGLDGFDVGVSGADDAFAC